MNKYYLFLDECGDQNLANFDPAFPIFTLCGIIVSQEQLGTLTEQIQLVKSEYWGEKKSFSIRETSVNARKDSRFYSIWR